MRGKRQKWNAWMDEKWHVEWIIANKKLWRLMINWLPFGIEFQDVNFVSCRSLFLFRTLLVFWILLIAHFAKLMNRHGDVNSDKVKREWSFSELVCGRSWPCYHMATENERSELLNWFAAYFNFQLRPFSNEKIIFRLDSGRRHKTEKFQFFFPTQLN